MACSKEVYCGPCEYENIMASATKWCTECGEGFCNECLKGHKAVKLTRNHHVIPVEDYLKTESFAVNPTCTDHDTKFDFFCPAHDRVLCVVCVQQHHSKCTGLLALEEASKNVKTSTALSELEANIEGILKNIDKGKHNLQHTQKSVSGQEEAVCKMIENKREQLNKHFDMLQKKLLSELTANRQKCQNKFSILTTSINEKQSYFLGLKEQVEIMKNFASNHQTFLGIRTMQQKMNEEEKKLKPLIVSGPECTFTYENNPKFQSVLDEIDLFGRVQVVVKLKDQAYVDHKIAQAQYQQPSVTGVDAIRLVLNKTLRLKDYNANITTCLILPNKEMMFVGRGKKELYVCKSDGSFCRKIKVKAGAFSGTIIDENRVALTYMMIPAARTIDIINYNTGKTENILSECFESWGWGVAYHDAKVYVYDSDRGINIVNLDGTVVDTVRIKLDSNQIFSVLGNGCIICLDKCTIKCVDIKGNETWKYTDPRFQKMSSLTNDTKGTLYAICRNGDVIAISDDGQQTKVILSDPNEPEGLSAAHFDTERRQLLLCNSKTQTAYIYDVV